MSSLPRASFCHCGGGSNGRTIPLPESGVISVSGVVTAAHRYLAITAITTAAGTKINCANMVPAIRVPASQTTTHEKQLRSSARQRHRNAFGTAALGPHRRNPMPVHASAIRGSTGDGWRDVKSTRMTQAVIPSDGAQFVCWPLRPPGGAKVSRPAICGIGGPASQDGRGWCNSRRFRACAKDWHRHAAAVRLIFRSRQLAPRDGSRAGPDFRETGVPQLWLGADRIDGPNRDRHRRLHRPRRVDRACQPPRT